MAVARPNILFLMSDEHRADVAGFAGNSVVKTPVLDELARTGIVFDNAYTPSPICIPARQAMMSGQHCKTINCLRYGDDLEPFSMTFARRFAQYAYTTCCSGKLHHLGADQMQGWTKRIAPDAEVGRRYIDVAVDEEFKRYHPAEGIGKWSNQKEIERAGVADGKYQHFDRFAVDQALQFIEDYFVDPCYDRPECHRPLLLKVSLIQPHYPFFTDREKFSYYLNRVPICQEERSEHPVLSRTQYGPDVDASERDIRRATAAYYGMVETVDQQFGKVLKQLEAFGQNLDDWIIVYTSDHGDMLGEHGIWEKSRFYEGSVRVPLIIRWPNRFAGGTVVKQNVNLIDLFATLCELADIPCPDDLDSRSLVALMEGDHSDWDNETISHFFPDHLMIKRDDLKYQSYGPDRPEILFDLNRDPKETKNLIDEPDYAESVRVFRERRRMLGY
jgi:choline-sulfatase